GHTREIPATSAAQSPVAPSLSQGPEEVRGQAPQIGFVPLSVARVILRAAQFDTSEPERQRRAGEGPAALVCPSLALRLGHASFLPARSIDRRSAELFNAIDQSADA